MSSTKVKIDGLRLDDNFFVDAEKEGSIKILSDNQGADFQCRLRGGSNAFGVQNACSFGEFSEYRSAKFDERVHS